MPHVARLPRPALRSLALAAWATLALAMASVGAGCASGERAGAAPIADDPRWEGARRCLARAALVDRVEGGVAVVVARGDPATVVPRSRLPEGAAEGWLLVDGVRAAACERAVRAYVRALRQASRGTWDNDASVRLE